MTLNTNPFIVSGKIPVAYFCDRKEETALLKKHLENHENVVLMSQRRMGKTKLIDHTIEHTDLGKEHITMTIDILHTTSFQEFVQLFGTVVFQSIARRSSKMMKMFIATLKSLSASFGFDPVHGVPTFDIKLGDIQQPTYTLKEIFEVIEKADKRCLVVFDEFQQVSKYDDANAEAILRSHIQHINNANFVFSGSQRRLMEEMFFSEKRPFYLNARSIQMNAIPLKEYQDFAQSLFQEAEKDINPVAVENVYMTFSGVTLYLQRIMKDAFSITPKGECCDKQSVEEIIANYVTENASRLREQLSFISESQKELLYAIGSETKPVKNITSAKFIKQHRMKSASSVQAAAKKLLEYDFLTRSEGFYDIADPLLAYWLRHGMM